jgi:hypothetical protein
LPILALFARVGRNAADSIILVMPRGLHRYYGAGSGGVKKLWCKEREEWGSHGADVPSKEGPAPTRFRVEFLESCSQ